MKWVTGEGNSGKVRTVGKIVKEKSGSYKERAEGKKS